MNGPLGIENDILDRLQEWVGPLARVASQSALLGSSVRVDELVTEHGPLILLEPDATGVRDRSSRSDHVVEEQTWIAVVALRHVSDPESLRVDYTDADALVTAIVRGITGWQPPAGVREMRYVGRSEFIQETAGILEIEITFECLFHISAE